MSKFRFIKGFSLIEMTITLAILGILVTGSVKFIDLYKHRDAEAITNRRLEVIKDALMIYRANNYGSLPCPADLTAPLQSDEFGFEGSAQTNLIFHCVGGNVTNLNVANSSIWDGNDGNIPSGGGANVLDRRYHGTVPVRTLNLPPEYAFDGWGNRISYLVHMAKVNGKNLTMHDNCGDLASVKSWWHSRGYNAEWAYFCGRGTVPEEGHYSYVPNSILPDITNVAPRQRLNNLPKTRSSSCFTNSKYYPCTSSSQCSSHPCLYNICDSNAVGARDSCGTVNDPTSVCSLCSYDGNCSGGRTCRYGFCVANDAEFNACLSNHGPSYQYCQDNKNYDYCVSLSERCLSDSDCEPGNFCDSGFCIWDVPDSILPDVTRVAPVQRLDDLPTIRSSSCFTYQLYYPCEDDSDCSSGNKCLYNICESGSDFAQARDSCGTLNDIHSICSFCSSDGNCSSGKTCRYGFCVANNTEFNACLSNHGPSYQYCQDHKNDDYCIALDRRCFSDSDCALGKFCDSGICVAKEVPGTFNLYYRNSGSSSYEIRLITEDAEYLLISHGKSGEGGYNKFGARNKLPSLTEKQLNTPCQGCAFTGDPTTWIAFSDTANFDDIVEYETREQQLIRCNNAGIKSSKCKYLTLRTETNT